MFWYVNLIAFIFFQCLYVICLYNLFMKMLKKHLFKKIRTDYRPSVRAHALLSPDVRA